ncbi:16S rRNA (cytosine(967)-C(5))-methyltransferase [Halorhodospira abdelmalekii]|uniref:16S rRNA (cytosine(967)-C(5))-methyltransferase RsmB n=1 Tax=Halorhodospira abdelmalekii TaxID=421629 RepID=UPI001903A707|nr:16S rRNA (cytosine(967)-C(5))-methyltransferase RsmB [Halorhodospira abdelmalekii]MBK1734396.1 16S rRNA (cytosine(967)-C(5))-methyltransferase [Halorhodospira abdelmalekii]
MSGAPPRVVAARILERILRQRESLDEAWSRCAGQIRSADQPLIQALLYGALRWLPQLEAAVAAFTPRQDWRRDSRLRALLILGAWEARGLSTPPHAAVSEAVAAARALQRPRAAGLVNAVLRRLQQRHSQQRPSPKTGDADPALAPASDSGANAGCAAAADPTDPTDPTDPIDPTGSADPEIRWAFPGWLLERLAQALPVQWQQVVEASNRHPPLTLRVNLAQGTRQAFQEELAAAGHLAHPGGLAASALRLEQPCRVETLPGFARGRVAVQDEAAQLAAEFLDPQPGERLLDACAAPGGKSVHLLERCPESELTALDRSARRLRQVVENLERAGLSADCRAADAAVLSQWWDGRPYHKVLLDAPCTGTGVIRRHPDIKWLREPADAARQAQAQRRLLEALWQVLAPGGQLLYATCSLLPDENEQVVARFLAEHPEAEALPLPAYGHATGAGIQLLPGDPADTDGFYYALLQRR